MSDLDLPARVAPTPREFTRYPAISDPQQSLASLQQCVLQLKEAVEMLTGARGATADSVQGMTLDIKKRVETVAGTLSARIFGTSELFVTQDVALAQTIKIVEAEVVNARGTEATLSARITQVDEANVSATEAAAISTNVVSARLTGPTADLQGKLTTEQLVNINAVDGIELKFGVTGFINGATGGFVFTGTQAIGGGAVFNMEFNSNVIIQGNLLVTGTVNYPQLTANAATQTGFAVSGGTSVAVAITTRGGPVEVIAEYDGETGYSSTGFTNLTVTPSPSFGFADLYRNGALLVSKLNNMDVFYTYSNIFAPSGGGFCAYAGFMNFRHAPTSVVFTDFVGAGTYTYQLNNSRGGTLRITVKELLR